MKRYCEVRLFEIPFHLDRPFTYSFSEEPGIKTVGPGSFVMVPFGNGNRRVRGVVTAVLDAPKEGLRAVKPVLSVISPGFSLDEEQIALAEFIREQTFCTFGEAARCLIPAGAMQRLYNRYTVLPDAAEAVAAKFGTASGEAALYELLAAKKGPVSADALKRILPELGETDARLYRLCAAGFVTRTTAVRSSENIRYRVTVSLLIGTEDAEALIAGDPKTRAAYGLRTRSTVYPRLLKEILSSGENDAAAILSAAGAATTHLSMLEKCGIVKLEKISENRMFGALSREAEQADLSPLSEEQENAVKILSGLYQKKTACAALLFGVTGSGKTRVIKEMADRVIADGRQVIMLVPEISLTPQSIRIFCAAYGRRVAVLHSALSEGERLDEWRRIREGGADLVIGTRSAVFAPVPDLGMIVIDEEQEHTYKSDITPKYHARDIARFRCASAGALMLLASATPSLESYYKAKEGVYTLVEMKNRYGGVRLPEVVFADMRKDREAGNTASVGTVLLHELEDTLAKGEQSILFLNRRGYHNYISCLSCGEPVVCPHCSVTMTAHLAGKGRRSDYDAHGAPKNLVLICHYCGYRCAPPPQCPSCGSEHLMHFGFGTQRTEDALEHLLPRARILRMDADTTRGKDSHRAILESFRKKEADILLGTQMVTKGHDFPDVTLAAVLNADAMLAQDDFRASERTFSVIVQMLGRAGRHEAGKAIIQTSNPDHPSLKLAAAQDYPRFFEGAIAIRRALSFPPFCDIVSFSLSSEEEPELARAGRALREELMRRVDKTGAFSDVVVEVFGPFEAQIYRVAEKYRLRMIVKCRSNKRTRALLREVYTAFSGEWGSRIAVGIDVNPSML